MRTIYIVDDDDPVRASLQSLLSVRKNLLIRSFRSGDAFLEQVEELDPGVLLLDFNMPGSNGLEVLRALRPYGSRFVAIILTGQAISTWPCRR
jgi:two-component system response regulator FixJ